MVNIVASTLEHKYKVGILGATGAVGQRFLALLGTHLWFEVTRLGASERSVGRQYGEVVNWKIPSPLPSHYRAMPIVSCNASEFVGHCELVFSGLDASVAGNIETEMANAGLAVFSNAKNHRYAPDVPILIPFINPDHLEAIQHQSSFINSGGFIVTNANCSSTGLSIALAPIYKSFGGIQRLFVATLQAISGAGYPGLPSLDILDNVIPFISGEEEKIEIEPNKILGRFDSDRFVGANIKISAICHRVPVTDGHTVSVSLELSPKVFGKEELIQRIHECFDNFKLSEEVARLPSCPSVPILVRNEPDRPQPRLDRDEGKGMTTVVGRIRPCSILDIKMTVTSHNTIIGAAGGSILNAELAVSRGYVKKSFV